MGNSLNYLQAMKAEHIPESNSNLWYILKRQFDQPIESDRRGKLVTLPAGVYTFLYRLTDATMMHLPPGEVVMEDTPFELATHLGFIMGAYGRVLVTGLGLGCVVRGLLLNPRVESVTVIENSKDVLKMVAPYMGSTKVKIIEADALEWTAKNTSRFDCAWHDLWTDRAAGEPHLDFWHVDLLRKCRRFTDHQGAWALDRITKRKLKELRFPWMG